MSQEEDAAKAAVLALHNALTESAEADGDADFIVDNHERWIESSRDALEEIDLFLSGERRRFGILDDDDLKSLFLCGDDFVAIMNSGSLHLTMSPSPNGSMIKFRPRNLWGRCAWEDLFQRR